MTKVKYNPNRQIKNGVVWILAAIGSLMISAEITKAVYEPAPLPIGELSSASPGLKLTMLGLLFYFSIITSLAMVEIGTGVKNKYDYWAEDDA